LLEEVARLYGYSKIIPSLPERDLTPVKPNPISDMSRVVIKKLTGMGMDEVLTYSFVGRDIYENTLLSIESCLEIENPISPDLSHMRNTLIPSLIAKVKDNARYEKEFSIFEIGRRIEMELDDEGIHIQPRVITGAIYIADQDTVYYNAKGVVENLLSHFGVEAEYEDINEASKHKAYAGLHPSRSAAIMHNEKLIGVVGELHPQSQLNWGLDGRVGVFEIEFDYLLNNAANIKKYSPLSQYQSVERDLSFWVNKKHNYSELLASIDDLKLAEVVNVSLQDIYEPKGEERKSITIKVTLQSDIKTLEEKEINEIISKIIKEIELDLKAELRGKK
ncbi:hypothetical protein KC909_06480, partial [Candidatus Dojkabacteria bacterium]|nr:hypothetical protein [Candidatus Dojkabacteria bacterium]